MSCDHQLFDGDKTGEAVQNSPPRVSVLLIRLAEEESDGASNTARPPGISTALS